MRASQLIRVFDGRVNTTMVRTSAVFAVGLLAPFLLAAQPSPSSSPPLFARCEAEAKKQFGEKAASGGLSKDGLKRLRGSQPRYPELPQGTLSGGLAVHEVLIGPDGKVRAVWPVREPTFTAVPAFSQAIVEALLTWEYEPHRVGGVARPVCLVVSTRIEVR